MEHHFPPTKLTVYLLFLSTDIQCKNDTVKLGTAGGHMNYNTLENNLAKSIKSLKKN